MMPAVLAIIAALRAHELMESSTAYYFVQTYCSVRMDFFLMIIMFTAKCRPRRCMPLLREKSVAMVIFLASKDVRVSRANLRLNKTQCIDVMSVPWFFFVRPSYIYIKGGLREGNSSDKLFKSATVTFSILVHSRPNIGKGMLFGLENLTHSNY